MANVSLVGVLGRMVVSLGVVVGLMVMVGRIARRRMGSGALGPQPHHKLQVIARQSVGKGAAVATIRAGDRILLLGVTEHGVSLLSEADLPQTEPEPAGQREPVPPKVLRPLTLADVLERARELTVRRV